MADRPVGAQPGVAEDQAAVRQSRRRWRRPTRCTTIRSPPTWAARRPTQNLKDAGLAARHPPGQRHGAQPHGHRLPLGDRASGLVHRPGLQPVSLLPVQRAGPVHATSRVGIFLEDHYYTRSDAAVVFKRVDRWTGSEQVHLPRQRRHQHAVERHGPAELSSIPRCARRSSRRSCTWPGNFPIIRFDAAMTLAKKHYQRLWYPEPGTGGAIPSRAEHGLTREQFDACHARRVLARGGGPRRPAKCPTRCCWPRRSG